MKGTRLFPAVVVLLEVLLISLILWSSGVIFSREDPLLIKQKYSPTLLVALVLSLYYGFTGGILFIAAVFAVAFFYYKPFPYLEFLWDLLIVLIASEFRYYWGKMVRSAEQEKEYLEEQVSRLRKELFLLKLSHDQLELNYVIKPYSLRRMLEEIKQKLITERNEKVLMNFLLSILMQNFQVYGATLFKYSQGQLRVLAQLGNGEEHTLEEPLLRKAIEEESSFYLPPKALRKFTGEGRGFRYLAVIVSKAEGELYILAISDILFVNLNEEVLNYMLIILSYVAEDVAIGRKLASLYAGREVRCNFNFLKELYKMYELFKDLGIESSVVIFTWQEGISPHHEYEFERTIRGLDVMCFLYEERLALFLLPFTAYAGAVSFSERMRKLFPELKLLGIKRVERGEIQYYLPGEER
ncbi:MAG: hypothetical protein GXN96_04500 [Aquificae bacterium]|nr:hypothetical protein [Aquificota bacterium]